MKGQNFFLFFFVFSALCWWECRLVQPLWKTVWNFLRKLKIELPFDLAVSILKIYPKNPKIPIQKNICTPMFVAALFTIATMWRQPKCPSVKEWIKKKQLWFIYTTEYCAALRRKKLLTHTTTLMNPINIRPKVKEARHKRSRVYNSIYIKLPEKADL